MAERANHSRRSLAIAPEAASTAKSCAVWGQRAVCLLLLRREMYHYFAAIVALERMPELFERLHPAAIRISEGIGMRLAFPDDDRRVDAVLLVADHIEA